LPLASFASGLRALRNQRKITYLEMAALANYSVAVLADAAAGRHLPTLQVTLAFVRVCGGDENTWRRNWMQARSRINPRGAIGAHGMNDPDPTQAASLRGLAECLGQLYLPAATPSLRKLEARTYYAHGLLPGTSLERVRLGRTAMSEALRGRRFPRKAFLLTFVEALNVDLKADRRWEQAWDRIAQYLDQATEAEVKQLRRQLAEARAQAARAGKEAEQLRRHLADAQDLSHQQNLAVEARLSEVMAHYL
jgi:transcriptional regulator with XRE-family HTH domain